MTVGPAVCPEPGTSQGQLEAFWQRQTVGWHAIFLGLIALVALMIATNDGLARADQLIGWLLLATMAGCYLLIGRRALGDEPSPLGPIHLVISWGALYGLLALDIQDAYVLLFALIPQVWAMLPVKGAVTGIVVLISGLAIVKMTASGWSMDNAVEVLPGFILQMGLALLLGLVITGVFVQADKRATLIDELERTRSELATAEHARGAMAERERLSHEIHDTLAQGFTSVLTLAQAIDVSLEKDPAAARERLALLEATARENLAEARALVGALAPLDLQNGTLPEAIERVAVRFERETGVAVDVRIDGNPQPLTANAEVVLLRAAQEALANVHRHSGAARVTVGLWFRSGSESTATIAVVDDGCGFDPGDDRGFGLNGMRSRIEQAGGRFEIISAPGMGTTVRATVSSTVSSTVGPAVA